MVVIWFWVSRSPFFHQAWPQNWNTGYQWARFRRLLGLGVPVAITLSFEAGLFGGAALIMGWLGATALAAHQIAISCAAFVFMFPLGLAMAVSMRMGRAVGERRLDALRPIGFSAQAMSAALMLLFVIVFVAAGRPISAAFVSDTEVVSLAVQLLVVAAIFLLADGAQVVGANAVRGLTDVKVPTVITAISYWGLAMPLSYGLGMHTDWGPVGVWIGMAVGLILAAVALNVRFIFLTRDGGAHVVLEKKAGEVDQPVGD
jgi:MATE family multidrug resistance protein